VRTDGLWHAELVGLLLDLRHTDTVVIADAGLPVPSEVPVVDLGWRRGAPRVRDLLPAVLDELVVERAALAKELADPDLRDFFRLALAPAPVDWVSHDELKTITAQSRAVVRTGDDTPFVNVVLHAGVPFGAEAGR
jgi:D-ribose pyranase